VTLHTTYVVVGWSKTIFDSLAFREDEFVVFKPAVSARGGWLWFVDAFVDRCALHAETVEQVVGLGVIVGGWGELKGRKSAIANKIRVRIGRTFLIFDLTS
jgi:hypothetical protein